MKKNIFLLLSICLLVQTQMYAQMTAIPDLVLRNKLVSMGFSSCMNSTYDSINASCPLVTTITNLNLSSGGNPPYIQDISGIEVFSNLTSLDISYNQISNVNNLPANLQQLIANDNLLSNWPNLPANMQTVSLSNNNVGNIPTNLPATMQSIACVNCNINSVTSNLPPNLWGLQLDQNSITNLNGPLPVNLITLTLSNNPLSTLPTTLPLSLQSLSLEQTNITSIPNLPQSLIYLSLKNTAVSVLPNLPDSLNNINIRNCPINNLPDKVPSMCATLDIWGTNISCIPMKNFSMSNYQTTIICDTNNIKCSPYEHFLFKDTSNFASVFYLPLCNPNSLTPCPINWNISGKVFEDANTNCAYNSGEPVWQNMSVNLLDKQGNLIAQTFTSTWGEYAFDLSTFDTFYVYVDTNYNGQFHTTCNNYISQQIIHTAFDSVHADIHFGLACSANTVDERVYASARIGGMFFPGQLATIKLLMGQQPYCNSSTGGKIKLYKNGNAILNGVAMGSLPPQISSPDSIVWQINDFNTVNWNTDFNVQVLTNTTAQIGQQICFTTTIETNISDMNPADNTQTSCFPVINSYDPNDKQVQPFGDITSLNEWLTYTVRFQNTGTATAFNIVIADTLDSHLRWDTFELLQASHPVLTKINAQGALQFTFANIMLPDSNSNEPGSHGYVVYRIKQKSNLPAGTNINNTAHIYFDYNSPVITNTTISHIALPQSAQALSVLEDGIKVYPNPTQQILHVDLPATITAATMQIKSVTGQTLLSQQLTGTNTIQVAAIPPGIYMIQVNLPNGEMLQRKFVKQ